MWQAARAFGMRERLILLALAGLVPFAASAGAEPARPRVEILSYGEYRARPHTRLEPAPDTAAGVVGLVDDNPDLVARTAAIVAAPGVSFGLVVGAPGLAGGQTLPVTVRLDHPPITAPDGRVWRTETSETTLTAGPKFTGFCFDHAWELAAGEWTYTLLHESRPIVSQRFTLTVDATRAIEARCRAEDAVS